VNGSTLNVLRKCSPIWFAALLLYAVSGLFSPGMFQVQQVLNILQVSAFLGLIATGQTLALLVGGIDLSVAGVVTMVNIVATSVMAGRDSALLLGLLLCLLLSCLVGLINGLLITWLRVTPLVATLGVNSILFGSALVYTGGAPHGGISPGFAFFGQGHLTGFPVSTICWLLVAFFTAWIMRATVLGRQLYAVGANSAAARLVGMRVYQVTIAAYVLSSVLAGLGGLLLTSYIGSPSLGIGDQFLLSSIAATVVGGTALTGGIGSVIGTIGGTLFITELASFTNVVHVSTGTQFVLQGAVIACSVLLYRWIGLGNARIMSS
jgi:ribose transport system permease protein